MKVKLFAAMLLFTTTVNAECENVSGLAESVMSARQQGLSMRSVLAAVVSDNEDFKAAFKDMVMQAYSSPRFISDEMQQRATTEFGNLYMRECLK